MIKKRSVAAVASCLVTAAVLSLPSGTGAEASASMYWGFNSWVSEHNVADQAKLGDIRVRRMFVYWDQVQPKNPDTNLPIESDWNWSTPDLAYKTVTDAALRPLIVVQNSPNWARPSRGSNQGPPDPAYEGYWREFLRRVVHRYNLDVPAETPDRRAIAFEIWNEPNLTYSFNPVSAPRYTEILQTAYATIKAENSNLKVISAGLGPTDGSSGNAKPLPYLEEMFIHGAASAMDGIGIHIYPDVGGQWNPAAFGPALDGVREKRNAVGATQQIWITEVGVSTAAGFGWPLPVSEEQQKQYLLEMIDAAKNDSDVAAMMIHTVADAPAFWAAVHSDGVAFLNNGLGVFRSTDPYYENTEPKPAACAISQEFGGDLNC